MATSITSAFMAKLLAQIPADEEQADTKQFRAQITRDMMRVWRAGMRAVEVTKAHHRIAADAFSRSSEASINGTGPAARYLALACQAFIDARRAQCLIPAPTPVQMRWKQRNMGSHYDIPEAVTRAIGADAARFAEDC